VRLSPGMDRQSREGGERTSRDMEGASRDGLLERRPSTFSLESASSFDLGLPRSSMEVWDCRAGRCQLSCRPCERC
jgi:hypothetical protein